LKSLYCGSARELEWIWCIMPCCENLNRIMRAPEK
jgi:hypothetical protein